MTIDQDHDPHATLTDEEARITAAPPPRRRRILIIVASVAALVLALGTAGVAVAISTSRETTPPVGASDSDPDPDPDPGTVVGQPQGSEAQPQDPADSVPIASIAPSALGCGAYIPSQAVNIFGGSHTFVFDADWGRGGGPRGAAESQAGLVDCSAIDPVAGFRLSVVVMPRAAGTFVLVPQPAATAPVPLDAAPGSSSLGCGRFGSTSCALSTLAGDSWVSARIDFGALGGTPEEIAANMYQAGQAIGAALIATIESADAGSWSPDPRAYDVSRLCEEVGGAPSAEWGTDIDVAAQKAGGFRSCDLAADAVLSGATGAAWAYSLQSLGPNATSVAIDGTDASAVACSDGCTVLMSYRGSLLEVFSMYLDRDALLAQARATIATLS